MLYFKRSFDLAFVGFHWALGTRPSFESDYSIACSYDRQWLSYSWPFVFLFALVSMPQSRVERLVVAGLASSRTP